MSLRIEIMNYSKFICFSSCYLLQFVNSTTQPGLKLLTVLLLLTVLGLNVCATTPIRVFKVEISNFTQEWLRWS